MLVFLVAVRKIVNTLLRVCLLERYYSTQEPIRDPGYRQIRELINKNQLLKLSYVFTTFH